MYREKDLDGCLYEIGLRWMLTCRIKMDSGSKYENIVIMDVGKSRARTKSLIFVKYG